MKKKLETIKNKPHLAATFTTLLATLVAFNVIFAWLFIGPMAAQNTHNLVIATLLTVIETAAVIALFRGIPHHEGEMSEEPLKA
jgi:hypothetical protein